MLSKTNKCFLKSSNFSNFSQSLSYFSQQTALTINKSLKYSDPKALVFKYPRYESPFCVSINPNYSKWMDRYCTQWALDNSGQMKVSTKYRQSILNSDSGLFSALTYPSANWHRCEKLMKWSLIFFICDDYQDICVGKGFELKCEPFWSYLTEILDNLNNPGYNLNNDCPDFVKGVQQILREIYFDYTPAQIKRSVTMVKDYILGNLSESKWNTESIDWDCYLNARLGSIGGHMTLQLIEYAKDIVLTDEEWNHYLIQDLNVCVSEQLVLINDFYTFRKEIVENNENFYQMKHPFPLLVNQGFTLQTSVNKVKQMIEQKDKEIFKQIDKIEKCDQLMATNILHYILGVKEVLGGYWRHAITARRYHGFNCSDIIPIEGQFTYDKHKTIIISNDNYKNSFDWNKPIPKNIQPC